MQNRHVFDAFGFLGNFLGIDRVLFTELLHLFSSILNFVPLDVLGIKLHTLDTRLKSYRSCALSTCLLGMRDVCILECGVFVGGKDGHLESVCLADHFD